MSSTQALAQLRSELDQQVVMMLTASFEAIFRTDFESRMKGQKRNDWTRRMRRWWRHQGRGDLNRVRLDRLLDGFWKETISGHRQAIGQLKALFLRRHWLAARQVLA